MQDNNFKRNDRNGFYPRSQGPDGKKFSHEENEKQSAESCLKSLYFKPEWISKEADADLIIYAENAGMFMAKNGLTNSKIRSIYGEIKRIQMGNFEKEKPSFFLLKPKVAYALGRDERNEGLKLFKKIFDNASNYVHEGKDYLNFCNLLEAILAYHKAYGGKD